MFHDKFPALIAGALGALILGSAAQAQDAVLREVIAGPQRSEAHQARDAARNPYDSLVFWGLKPGQTVIEISPGSGYWTEILAPYALKTEGTYVAGVADLEDPALSDAARKGREAFAAKYDDAAVFGEISYAGFGATSKPLGEAGSADLVLTARNIHNWMTRDGMLDKVLADFYAVLKPGGVLAVEEHRADPRPEVEGVRDGYVSTATVVAAAEKAGFQLAESSEINANPKDTKDHPFGVWTLPPVRQSAARGETASPDFDRAKYDAIGESDRMTLRFVKPS
ncbi:class I SAM-dependent methyltransferase [Phenylobacterium sp.]|uniref:class I SAM-dependent methyltransferase n=1 Tax=Phenylobacterium sp. TaxID=1871053 RepID=UPI002730353D|nr:methyltransferase domain-containing protein [Phenylobacterium sp.]MDP1619212.1 methyltransferase domain-containing protein [Phenylobacterium sp.]MDP1988835.1 methyltransferase domain-containing protein [Phenylobacterium sp.]